MPGGSGTYGQGNRGGNSLYVSPYSGGGGGGAGAQGQDWTTEVTHPGYGGIGINYSSIFGTMYGEDGWFAGGGAGAWYINRVIALGGLGGGGNETLSDSGEAGYANTGGGGGGHHSPGGSGIILVRYQIN